MKLINFDKLQKVSEDEVNMHPYVTLAKQVREAPEVRALPEEYIDNLMLWISEHHPHGKRAHQYMILLALKRAYREDWRPWDEHHR